MVRWLIFWNGNEFYTARMIVLMDARCQTTMTYYDDDLPARPFSAEETISTIRITLRKTRLSMSALNKRILHLALLAV